jgi:hypothetical protein
MGDLSPHFSRKEFECRCCGRLVLDDNLLDDSRHCESWQADPWLSTPDTVVDSTTR